MLNNKFINGKTLFSEWAAQFISIVSMYRSAFKQVLHDAQHSPSSITTDDFSERDIQSNKQLYGIIIQLVSGDALTLVKNIPDENGLEVLRRLWTTYAPTSAPRLV